MNGVVLKAGKERIFAQRNHWIFSGAIDSYPKDYKSGSLVPIYSATKELLGYGYFNRKTNLVGRIVSFGSEDPYRTMTRLLYEARLLRRAFFHEENTDAYRLVNGEGDLISGLIIDRYGPYLVIQIGTLGMQHLKGWLIDELKKWNVQGIYEKSTAHSRKEEGLSPEEGVLCGEIPDLILIKENHLSFFVSIRQGQKTGFFLDQRHMRQFIGEKAHGKKVLNCFSYSGGFTVYALSKGASHVDSVDISEHAKNLCQKNLDVNHLGTKNHRFFQEDVFAFLREKPLEYDIVILDPPAFAKKKEDIPQAWRGYLEINKTALKKMPSRSFLLTCSCSYHIDEAHFHKILLQAAKEAKKEVRIISKHHLAYDHPINLFHPQIDYLKSLYLYVI